MWKFEKLIKTSIKRRKCLWSSVEVSPHDTSENTGKRRIIENETSIARINANESTIHSRVRIIEKVTLKAISTIPWCHIFLKKSSENNSVTEISSMNTHIIPQWNKLSIASIVAIVIFSIVSFISFMQLYSSI